jgi:signal transduction histidine kinase
MGLSARTPVVPATSRIAEGGAAKAALTGRERQRWIVSILAFPLAGKLVGANALIVIVTMVTAIAVHGSGPRDAELLTILAMALVGSFAVNLALVIVALRPLRALEGTAERVRRGDLDARVPASPLADRDLRRVGDAFNVVLDHLIADRTRLLRLASEVIRVGDRERATLARELHDSTAQTLSAVVMQLAAATREVQQPELAARLETARGAALDALEEVRMLAHTVHPRVLDDLGLPAALRYLAREMSGHGNVVIDVDAPQTTLMLGAEQASVLYRVAQEAAGNALVHGSPTKILLRLQLEPEGAVLEVIDDGRGFDPSAAARTGSGLGIFSMRERVALVDGSFAVDSTPDRGTKITARIPFKSTEISRGIAS